MVDRESIKSGTNLFPKSAAGKLKLLTKLPGDSANLWRPDCSAASYVSAAAAGNFRFMTAVNERMAQDQKAIYNVVFKQHVEGKTVFTEESVLVTVDQQKLKQDINILCKETQFLEQDMRVSSACLSRTNTDTFWSIIFYKLDGAAGKLAVDVNTALQEIAPGRNWEHLPETGSQSRPMRKCQAQDRSAAQKKQK